MGEKTAKDLLFWEKDDAREWLGMRDRSGAFGGSADGGVYGVLCGDVERGSGARVWDVHGRALRARKPRVRQQHITRLILCVCACVRVTIYTALKNAAGRSPRRSRRTSPALTKTETASGGVKTQLGRARPPHPTSFQAAPVFYRVMGHCMILLIRIRTFWKRRARFP